MARTEVEDELLQVSVLRGLQQLHQGRHIRHGQFGRPRIVVGRDERMTDAVQSMLEASQCGFLVGQPVIVAAAAAAAANAAAAAAD